MLNQRTGLVAAPPIKLRDTYHMEGGNLAAGDGYLIVAQSDGLVVFCQNSRLIERYSEEIARAPERAANYFRLARAAEAIGREDTALESYRQALAQARPDETIDGISAGRRRPRSSVPPADAAGAPGSAQARLADRHPPPRIGRAVARTDAERLEARMLLAAILLDAGQPEQAVADLEELLPDARLRPLAVAADDGRRTIRADLMVGDRLEAIVRAHGRAATVPTIAERRRCWSAAGASAIRTCWTSSAAISRPPRSCPTPCSRWAGSTSRRAGWARPRIPTNGCFRPRRTTSGGRPALWSMARVYEARQLYVAACDAYLELAARYPEARPDAGARDRGAGRGGEARARPYRALLAGRRGPAIAPPMVRRWPWAAPSDRTVRAISAEGVVPSLEASRVVLGDGETVRLLDAVGRPGAVVDQARLGGGLGGLPRGQADRGRRAAGRRARPGAGTVAVAYQPSATGKDSGRPDPFAAADEDGEPSRRPPGRSLPTSAW